MDIRRVVLYSALALIIYSLMTKWQVEHPAPAITTHALTATSSSLLPTVKTNDQNNILISPDTATSMQPSNQLVRVKTDVLDLTIDLTQGSIIDASLLKYPVSVDEPNQAISLLQSNANNRYVANSELVTQSKTGTNAINAHFTSQKMDYDLGKNNTLEVVLTGKTTSGLLINKIFHFKRGTYLINIDYSIDNQSSNDWTGFLNTQLLRTSPQEDKSSVFHVGSYTGASYSIPGTHRYQKVNFKDMTKSNLEINAKGGWIAMQQHYFLSAWIPETNSENLFYTRVNHEKDYMIGAVSQPIVVKVGSHVENIPARLYLGPESTHVLQSIAPGLDMTVDYGMLWFISALLFSLMKTIYSWIGNWGWAIVLVTVLIKLAFYRLSATSYKSMAGMRKLQPKLQALRERYGDDKAKMSQATMELYRQEKVNPLGGCLPIVVQIPVFIALYWVLLESVELRQAPFIFWIKDLAVADPLHVLPIIMGITMLIQQKLNPAPPDPTQAKVMMFLPILFTGLFWSFPAGLVLYWIVNNTLSILQQWYITRKYGSDTSLAKVSKK